MDSRRGPAENAEPINDQNLCHLSAERHMKLRTLRRMKLVIPRGLRPAAKGLFGFWMPTAFKYKEEIEFWEQCWRDENGHFENDHYEKILLAMAGEPDDGFLAGKTVADFGCGPRGSLCWITRARLKIGIDVLTEQYAEFDIASHDMVYVKSTERAIPLASHYVDVLFTLNAMDHVSHFSQMSAEILRILKPGGLFIGSFNLDDPPTFSEPQMLTETRVRNELLRHLDVECYRVAAKGKTGARYIHFFDGSEPPISGSRFLWVRARNPSER